jgi:arginyl-tRNA synthetase
MSFDKISDIFIKVFKDLNLDQKYSTVVKSTCPKLCQYQCNGAKVISQKYKKDITKLIEDIILNIYKITDDYLINTVNGFINISIKNICLTNEMINLYKNPIKFSNKIKQL